MKDAVKQMDNAPSKEELRGTRTLPVLYILLFQLNLQYFAMKNLSISLGKTFTTYILKI